MVTPLIIMVIVKAILSRASLKEVPMRFYSRHTVRRALLLWGGTIAVLHLLLGLSLVFAADPILRSNWYDRQSTSIQIQAITQNSPQKEILEKFAAKSFFYALLNTPYDEEMWIRSHTFEQQMSLQQKHLATSIRKLLTSSKRASIKKINTKQNN